MKIKLFFILSFIFVLFSCSDDGRSDCVLSPKQMEDVMVDLHIADAVANTKNISLEDSLRLKMYSSVMLKHNTTIEQFDSSLTWYARRVDEFKEIHENVFNRLEEQNKK